MFQSILHIMSENKKLVLYIVFVALPPTAFTGPFSDSLRHPSFPLLLQHLEPPDEVNVMIYLLISLFVYL